HAEFIMAHYTKYEFQIPMRDGRKLFTAVYRPKEDNRSYPVLLMRTPYSVGPYGVDKCKTRLGPSPLFDKEGYIFVFQDVRGRWMSEGEFINMRPHNPQKKSKSDIDEASDTYDTIDWLIRNIPGHNGKVGQWGISYPGFYTAAGMIDAHPALVAVSPQAPVTDWFTGDDFHHNGAFFLPHCFNFMANFGKPRPEPTSKFTHMPFDHGTPDGYDFFLRMNLLSYADKLHFKGEVAFWNEMMSHGTFDDFWKSRNIRQYLSPEIKPAVLTVGGWYDAENLFGALEVGKRVAKPGNTLVMGPWVHGGWNRGEGESLGHVKFHAKTGDYYREKIQFPFFQYHLHGKGEWRPPAAWMFETGTNQWRKFEEWPAGNMHILQLRTEGKLLIKPIDNKSDVSIPSDLSFDEFPSDPSKPVPYFDRIAIGMEKEYMIADQRFAARRPDVLVFQTDVLQEDWTLAGPIEVDLIVSTTGTDADWIVKLIDVYPADASDPDPNPANIRMGGYQQLVRGDVLRGKFRNSLEKPEPFEPGKPTRVRFTLPDVLHTFRPGHRLMVQIQSTWFPLVDRNPQTFCDIYQAKEADFQKATHRVYHHPSDGSRLMVRVLPSLR
ncbi:MAG TPA: CocE/NonD family hydrolase, partial [Gemmatales bacterium]|nr:CocE/NonD family hydrolase [Gemmatales bacterium]